RLGDHHLDRGSVREGALLLREPGRRLVRLDLHLTVAKLSTTRDDAPAYLVRYEARRAEPPVEQAAQGEAPFVAQARRRATQRALAELDHADAPPGRTVAFARETVAPRELQWSEALRRRVTTSTDVRLIRHGQTQGYVADSALTALGRWQAHRKGQDLAKGLADGGAVRIVYAPTARARETAV